MSLLPRISRRLAQKRSGAYEDSLEHEAKEKASFYAFKRWLATQQPEQKEQLEAAYDMFALEKILGEQGVLKGWLAFVQTTAYEEAARNNSSFRTSQDWGWRKPESTKTTAVLTFLAQDAGEEDDEADGDELFSKLTKMAALRGIKLDGYEWGDNWSPEISITVEASPQQIRALWGDCSAKKALRLQTSLEDLNEQLETE